MIDATNWLAGGGRLGGICRRWVDALLSARGALFVVSFLFWYLRTKYWAENVEPPFSDIWGYVVTGDNIATRFFFGLDDRHPTYYTPITPGLIAIAKIIWPAGYETVFRLLVQVIVFVAALRIVRELSLLTDRKWLGVSFLLIVAICRPSIFWSLKLSTEPVCEAMLYATLATGLATLRTRSLGWAAVCGFFALCLGLNRPNFLFGSMFIPLSFLIAGYRKQVDPDGCESRGGNLLKAIVSCLDRRTALIAAVFVVAYLGTWSLWVGRNVINYGAFILTSASSGQSVIWEYGGRPVKIGRYDFLVLPDGTRFSNFGSAMEEANRHSPDFEGAKQLYGIARAWYAANWMDLPRLFMWRLKNIITNRGASGLTVLPREPLFFTATPGYNNPFTPVAWKELLLLDKEPLICFAGLVGAVLFLRMFPGPGTLLILVGVVPWFAAAAVIGYERTVESLVALTVWCSLFLLAGMTSALKERPPPHPASSR